jgi:hypothetical protein
MPGGDIEAVSETIAGFLPRPRLVRYAGRGAERDIGLITGDYVFGTPSFT